MSSLRGPRGHFAPLSAIVCLFFCLSFLLSSSGVSAQQNAPCSEDSPCKVGCCSSAGVCGFTKDHCGDGCLSNCNAKAECGEYAAEKDFDCPINVCCSKFGFCGITEEFCGDGCQKNSDDGGCGDPGRPSECSVNTDPLTYKRRIAYYELFTKDRDCNVKEPESLPLAPLTHLNLAFINFGSNFKLKDEYSDWVKRTVLRKILYPDLRINIAIGGWTFNDAPTATYFSDMVHSFDGRATFINSIVDYLRTYGLDGVDIDWEYPNAIDRGGTEGDNLLFNQFLGELKDKFEDEGSGWEISVTLPTSYWYLRGFNLESMQKSVDYFNVMSYDIHGMWDFDNDWTGPYLRGHTNWDEIDQGLDLLWRNGIKPENVVLGFGFYGRAFTMADANCYEPNGICEFATGGIPGSCSGEAGILTYSEIASRNRSLDVSTHYDSETTVKYNVFGGDQWVSYDDRQSFQDKLKHLSQRCLSGLMVWAIDQDTSDWQAMNELFGDFSDLQLHGLDEDSAEKLHDLFGQYTGQDCYVTQRCTDGSKEEQDKYQVCEDGDMVVDIAHNPQQSKPRYWLGGCDKGWYRRICCPKVSMPKHCEWNGAPERSEFGCNGKCGEGTFKLNQDTALTATGEGECVSGVRTLCCQGTKLIEDCFWNDCQGPLFPAEDPTCPDGYDFEAFRYNKPSGTGLCSEEYVSPVSGHKGSPQMKPFKSAFCCPKDRSFKNCNWSNDPPPPIQLSPELLCYTQPCRSTQIEIADALDPPESKLNSGISTVDCSTWRLGPQYDLHFPLCCDPPSIWNAKWPVDPDKLWELNFNDPKTDKAIWAYDDLYSNNDKDPERSNKEDGTDAYGFMMLNGEKEAIDDNFDDSHTVVRRNAAIPKMKREIFTRNQTIIDNVFEHVEETFMVYCNYPPGSEQCEAVWQGGVEDTIIKLPHHVGEGPFARIVSMKLAGKDYPLPLHHLKHRSLDALHENPVYEVKVDYNFHLARQDRGPVQMRVDYTNLLGYWDELTNSKASDSTSSRIKRAVMDDGKLDMRRFRDRIRRGEETDKRLKRRSAEVIKTTVPIEAYPVDRTTDVFENDSKIDKRWWGIFRDWLKRLTTVQKGEKGDLPLEWADEINLFKASWGCPGKSWSANLRMDLQAEVTMQATYAYYFSGTFIPPSKPDVFFYFGIEPEATVMLKLTGNAEMRYQSERKKIIDTIGYPGLAVKGIAAVGPTLDIYGQVKGYINIHGEAKAGATVNFGKSQAYWPQNDNNIDEYDDYLNLDLKEDPKHPPGPEVAPTFEAGVQVSAELDILVQPEANVGIKIGGGTWTGGRALVDAQVTAYMMGMLQFWATGKISTNTGSFDYQYAAYFYYNLGYKAKAVVLEWLDWSLGDRNAYSPDRRVTIYKQEGSIPLTANAKRTTDSGLFDNKTIGMDSLLDEDYVFKRADDGDQNLDPNKPQFTKPIACPVGDSADIRLPEMRFNCGAFPPLQVLTKAGTYQTTEAMCTGYKGVSGLPMTLTQAFAANDAQEKAITKRRTSQCPGGYCASKTSALHKAIGYSGPDMKLECDEFPWASSEEGGLFKDSGSRSQLCIPSAHNGLGGTCILMLSFLQQNVGKMEPSIEKLDDRKDAWVYWGNQGKSDMDFWFTNNTVKGSAKQRMVDYPNKQPIPVGYDSVSWAGKPDTRSWAFKRNYTFSIIDSGAPASAWWDATGKKFNKAYQFKTDAGYSSVVCGVNIFGQDTYYKNPKQGGTPDFNGLCLKRKRQTVRGWQDLNGASRCKIDFGSGAAPATGSTKRSTDSTTGEDMKIVHIFEDDDIDLSDPQSFIDLMERERAEAEAEEEREEQLRRGGGDGGVTETVSPREEGHYLSAEESRDVTLLNDAPMTSANVFDKVEIRAPVGLPSVNKET